MKKITVRAPAKVNLALSVGPAADDGYHELVNVFHAVSLFDEVSALPAETFSLSVSAAESGPTVGAGAGTIDTAAASSSPGPSPLTDVPLGDDNLALRAARLLASHAGVRGGAELRVRKSIPVAGGMAGGSADAAAALVACDALWETGLDRSALLRLAARLGADAAFPLVGGTAVGRGRGDHLTPVPSEISLHWVFALAEGGLSAATVYRECDRLRAWAGNRAGGPHEPHALLGALRTGDPAAVGAAMHNDLEAAALSMRPDLHRTLDTGRRLGALVALVSGSGPTCAFLARSPSHARQLAGALDAAGVCRAAVEARGPASAAHLARCTDPGAVASHHG